MTNNLEDRESMIMDACVLIDFIKADRSVLKLIVKHVGSLCVPSPVVEEVHEIRNPNELLELEVEIVEPEIDEAYAAVSLSGSLSFQDGLCLLIAKRLGLICVTNDKILRKRCKEEDIPILWGLKLLVQLHREGGIPSKDAISIAQRIHSANPKHITPTILKRFINLISKES